MNIAALMNIALQFKPRGTMRNLHPTAMPLWSLIKGIQENRALAELTAQGRQLLKDEGEKAFKAWKPVNLMSVYIGVRFKDKEGRADEANVGGYTGLAGFDFDDVEAEMVLKKLRDVPQVICAGISASGRGVWCVARVECATGAEYRACFADGIKAFEDAGFTGIDRGAHDPTRARFVAACPECWWRWEAQDDIPAFKPVGDLSMLRNPGKKSKSAPRMPKDYHISPELALDMARQIAHQAADVEDGNMNTEKARMCGQFKALAAKAGVEPAAFADLFVNTWDAAGSTPKKTRSIMNRLLLKGGKK